MSVTLKLFSCLFLCFVVFQPEQRFEEIVVSVDDRHVDLRACGFRADAVVDEEAALLSGGDQVAVRSERAEDFPGGLIIGLLPFGDIPGQFEQRRGRDGRCRGVARFVGDPRGVVIPVGHEVRGQAGMADEVFGALHGAVQVTFVARFAVAHRETVETPALAPRPGRSGRMALSAFLSGDAARPGVVADDVERTVVGAEVVFEGVVGMAHGDVVVAFVARESRGREQHFEVPFGKARIRRPGKDLTIITYGNTTHLCLNVAELLYKEKGWELEVIDLRTLIPLDKEAIFNSVKKTSKVLIVHEDKVFSGFGAEIAGIIGSELFQYLDAPIQRVGSLFTPVGFHPVLERAILPNEETIYHAAKELLLY